MGSAITPLELVLFLVVPLVFVLLALGLFLAVVRAMGLRAVEEPPGAPRDGSTGERPRLARWSDERPWWGRPLVWLGVSALLVVLGVLVVPQVLPGVVVFVPFLWIGRPRRRRRPGDPERSEERDRSGEV